MIGSVSEAQKQLADLEKRRQQIAARNAQSQSPPATAGAVAAPLAGWPVTGYTSAQVAKGTEPDIAKRRRKGKGRERAGREMTPGETAHAAVGQGYRDAMDDQADDAGAVKALDNGVAEGPGRHMASGPGEPPRTSIVPTSMMATRAPARSTRRRERTRCRRCSTTCLRARRRSPRSRPKPPPSSAWAPRPTDRQS